MEYWREVFEEALPLRYVLTFAFFMGMAYIYTDKVQDLWEQDAKPVVTEVVKTISSYEESLKGVTDMETGPPTVIAYAIDEDTNRVSRI